MSITDGTTQFDPQSIAGLTISIFADLLTTVTQDAVLEAHRSEKLKRMGMIQASKRAIDGDNTTEIASVLGKALDVPFTDEICPKCQLPRHTVESFAAPPIADKKWCTRPPVHENPGSDIYGNPAVNGSSITSKKARNTELATEGASPASEASQTPPARSAKTASLRDVSCMHCQRNVDVSRFAAHLEKCLGINNRKSSRTGAGRNSTTGNGASTPSLNTTSRRNSPASPASSVSSNEDQPPKSQQTENDKKPTTKKKGPTKKERAAAERALITSAPRADKAESPAPSSTITLGTGSTVKKKKKRKAEALDDEELAMSASQQDDHDGTSMIGRDQGDDSIALLKHTSKKQKHNLSETPTKGDHRSASPSSAGVRTQLSKFKNRAGSPLATSKGERPGSVEMQRSLSDPSMRVSGSVDKPDGRDISPSPLSRAPKDGPKTPSRMKSSMSKDDLHKSSKEKRDKEKNKLGLDTPRKDKTKSRSMEGADFDDSSPERKKPKAPNKMSKSASLAGKTVPGRSSSSMNSDFKGSKANLDKSSNGHTKREREKEGEIYGKGSTDGTPKKKSKLEDISD